MSEDESVYDVEFMNLVVDKADNLKVVDCDSHFSEFTGVHPSKIKQGKLFLHNIIKPMYREDIMKTLCKKNRRMFISTQNLLIKIQMRFLCTAPGRTMRVRAFADLRLQMFPNRLKSRRSLKIRQSR